MAQAPTIAKSIATTQDNLAARLTAGLLWSEWKQNRERKKRLQRRTVLSDCRLMLRYALDEGCQISDELSKNIAKIDTALIQAKLDPLSEVPKELIQKAQSGAENQQPQAQQAAVAQTGAEDQQPRAQQGVAPQPGAKDQQPQAQQAAVAQTGAEAPQSQAQQGVAPQPGAKDQQPQAQQAAEPIPIPTPTPTSESLNDVIMRVHNALSDLVAPATAQSLRATDPAIVWFGMPRIVQWAIYGACFFLLWFLFAVANSVKKQDEKTPEQTAKATASASSSPTQATPSPSPQNP